MLLNEKGKPKKIGICQYKSSRWPLIPRLQPDQTRLDSKCKYRERGRQVETRRSWAVIYA